MTTSRIHLHAEDMFRKIGMHDKGKEIITNSSREVITLNNQAVRMAQAGDLRGSVELLMQAVAKYKGNTVIVLNAVHAILAYMQAHGWDEELGKSAKEYLTTVKNQDPDNQKYLMLCGSVQGYRKTSRAPYMTSPEGKHQMAAREGLDAIDFTALFAAQIHDLKNLLFLLLNSLDETLNNCRTCSGTDDEGPSKLALLKYNGQLINDKLIQMLSLFRFAQGPYVIDIAYRPVEELIEEVVAEAKPLLGARSIAARSDVETGLCWFFDRDLAAGVLNNAIHNALHCARSEIRLSVAVENGFLAIRVEDDGDGFPAGNPGKRREHEKPRPLRRQDRPRPVFLFGLRPAAHQQGQNRAHRT